MKTEVMKKAGCMLLAMAIVVSAAQPVNAAKKLKLNKKTAKIEVGKTVKLSAVKWKKKVTWSSSNKTIATVSKKGLVKGIRVGKATITAKSAKKKATCKVTVTTAKVSPTNNPALNNQVINNNTTDTTVSTTIVNSQMAANITVQTTKLTQDKCIRFSVTNGNSVAVPYVKISAMFYSAAGAVVSTENVAVYNVAPGTAKDAFVNVASDKYDLIDETKTLASVTVDSSYTLKKFADKSTVVTSAAMNATNDKYIITFTNNTTSTLYVDGYVRYYDAAGQLMAVSWVYTHVDAGNTKFDETSVPYKSDYSGRIEYSTVSFDGDIYYY